MNAVFIFICFSIIATVNRRRKSNSLTPSNEKRLSIVAGTSIIADVASKGLLTKDKISGRITGKSKPSPKFWFNFDMADSSGVIKVQCYCGKNLELYHRFNIGNDVEMTQPKVIRSNRTFSSFESPFELQIEKEDLINFKPITIAPVLPDAYKFTDIDSIGDLLPGAIISKS